MKERKLTISDRSLKALKPESAAYEASDRKLDNFIVRVQPSGHKSYKAVLGRSKAITLGKYPDMTASRARTLASKAFNWKNEGVAFGEIKSRIKSERGDTRLPTLCHFLDSEFANSLTKFGNSRDEEIAQLKAAFPSFLELELQEISVTRINVWQKDRAVERAPETVNKNLETLMRCLRFADLKYPRFTLELEGVKKIETDDNKSVRYLSDDEEIALREALIRREGRLRRERASGNEWRKQRDRELLPELGEYFTDHLQPMVLLSLNTGIRQGELFNLHWNDIDLVGERLKVEGRTAKNKKTRFVPLNPEAHDVLSKWYAQSKVLDGLVFPNKKSGKRFNTIKTAWGNLLKDAGISNFRWHDLRHDFASKLVMAGASLSGVSALLGHSEIEMTQRYVHLAPDHLKGEVNLRRPPGTSQNYNAQTNSKNENRNET